MNPKLRLSLLATALLIGASQASATSYTFTDLGTLGTGINSYANAINASGQVVGASSLRSGGQVHATLWNGTAATDLGTLVGGRSFNVFSEATSINASGQVAGYSGITRGYASAPHATLWNGTTATDLGTLGGSDSVAYAINASGQVAGYSTLTGGGYHATLWNGTAATDLGTLGGPNSQARAINDSGQVAGYASNANWDYHATLWNGTAATDLGTGGDLLLVMAWPLPSTPLVRSLAPHNSPGGVHAARPRCGMARPRLPSTR